MFNIDRKTTKCLPHMYPTGVTVNSVRICSPADFPFRSCFRRNETFRWGLLDSTIVLEKTQIKPEMHVGMYADGNIWIWWLNKQEIFFISRLIYLYYTEVKSVTPRWSTFHVGRHPVAPPLQCHPVFGSRRTDSCLSEIRTLLEAQLVTIDQ